MKESKNARAAAGWLAAAALKNNASHIVAAQQREIIDALDRLDEWEKMAVEVQRMIEARLCGIDPDKNEPPYAPIFPL